MLIPTTEHLIKMDPVLGEIITSLPAPSITSTQNVFHDLISCILEQQIHYRSTKKIFQKMLDRSNVKVLTPETFPQFESKAFEGIKLSTKKYETVLHVLQHWEQNPVIWESLTDEEIVKELSQIKGVGKWSIEMILIYTLNRQDVFAYSDFHIKQIMTSLYTLNPRSKLLAQMKEVAQAWSPYKSTAFLYLLEWKTYNKSMKRI